MLNRNWGIKFEYDHVDLGGGITATINPTTVNRVNFATPSVVTISKAQDNVVSVAVNYHFH